LRLGVVWWGRDSEVHARPYRRVVNATLPPYCDPMNSTPPMAIRQVSAMLGGNRGAPRRVAARRGRWGSTVVAAPTGHSRGLRHRRRGCSRPARRVADVRRPGGPQARPRGVGKRLQHRPGRPDHRAVPGHGTNAVHPVRQWNLSMPRPVWITRRPNAPSATMSIARGPEACAPLHHVITAGLRWGRIRSTWSQGAARTDQRIRSATGSAYTTSSTMPAGMATSQPRLSVARVATITRTVSHATPTTW